MSNELSSFHKAMLASLDSPTSAPNALFVLAQEDNLPDLIVMKIVELLEDPQLAENAFRALFNKNLLPESVIAILFEKLSSSDPLILKLSSDFFLQYQGLVTATEKSKLKLIQVIKKTEDSTLRINLLAILVSATPTHPEALSLTKFLLKHSLELDEKKFIAKTVLALFAEQNLVDDELTEILANILRNEKESVTLRGEVAKGLSQLKLSDESLKTEIENFLKYTESIEYTVAELDESLPLSRQEDDFTEIMRDESQSKFFRRLAAENIVKTVGMNSALVAEAKTFLMNLPIEDSE